MAKKSLPESTEWKKVISFENATLNSALNSSDITDNEVAAASHVIFENKVAERGPGRSIDGECPLEGGERIDGIWRSWNKAGDKCLICAVNGKIKYKVDGGSWADCALPTLPNAASSLTKHVPYSFHNHDDKTLITNGYDPILVFDPSTYSLKLYGLEPLRFYKKIAYFESDETWVQYHGTVAKDTVLYRIDERTGDTKTSLKLTTSDIDYSSGYIDFPTAQDFSKFPNGILISNDDYCVIWFYHRIRDLLDTIQLGFETSTGNLYLTTIALSELDPVYLRDNQWTELKLKKSRFAPVGSPDWANITRFYVSVAGTTTVSCVLNVDNCYWKNSPMEVVKYKKVIDNFEGGTADWEVSQANIYIDVTYVKELNYSLKLDATGTSPSINKDVSLDLTQYIDGVVSQDSDAIHLWVYCNNTSYLTSLTLTLSEVAGSKYFSKLLTVAAGDFNKSTAGGWTEIEVMKKDFADTGTASWAAITNIKIDASGTALCNLYFDDWCLQESTLNKELSTMEPTEANPWTFPASSSGSGTFVKGEGSNAKFVSKGDYSISLTVNVKKSYYATRILSSPIDLTIFGASETSGLDDVIGFWIYWTNFVMIKSIQLIVDVYNGDFDTDCYTYEILPIELQQALNATGQKAWQLNNKSVDFAIKKSSFARKGTTADKGWGTVKGYKFIITAADSGGVKTTIYIDDLHMRRVQGLTGIYQWCCVPVASDGIKGAPSEWSQQTTLTGTRALLNILPLSADPDCVYRMIFRKGGALGSDARLSVTIWDNTTTRYFDDVTDENTGELLTTNLDIPGGTIRTPLIAKFCESTFMGRIIGYRDPTNLRRMWFSNVKYGYAWSELQAIDFDTDLLSIWVKDDILYINCKSGMKKIGDDLENLSLNSVQEMGLIKHCVSPTGSTPVDEMYAYVSYDGAYLFDGYRAVDISDPGLGKGNVRNYFDPSTYSLDQTISFYHRKHLYFVIVRTADNERVLLDFYVPEVSWRTQ